MIERIVVAGVSQSPSKIETEDGTSIDFTFNAQKNLVVLRKPQLPITKGWSVHFRM